MEKMNDSVQTLFNKIYVPLTPDNTIAVAEQKEEQRKLFQAQLDVVLTRIAASRDGYCKLGKHDKAIADVLEQHGFKVLVDCNGFGVVFGYWVCWDVNKYYEFIRDKGFDVQHLNKMFP